MTDQFQTPTDLMAALQASLAGAKADRDIDRDTLDIPEEVVAREIRGAIEHVATFMADDMGATAIQDCDVAEGQAPDGSPAMLLTLLDGSEYIVTVAAVK